MSVSDLDNTVAVDSFADVVVVAAVAVGTVDVVVVSDDTVAVVVVVSDGTVDVVVAVVEVGILTGNIGGSRLGIGTDV